MRGAGELELVRSGLDDTMRTAYQAMREVWHGRKDVDDLRVAAYLVSIGRVAAELPLEGALTGRLLPGGNGAAGGFPRSRVSRPIGHGTRPALVLSRGEVERRWLTRVGSCAIFGGSREYFST